MITMDMEAMFHFTYLCCTLQTLRNLMIYSNQWLIIIEQIGVSDPMPTI